MVRGGRHGRDDETGGLVPLAPTLRRVVQRPAGPRFSGCEGEHDYGCDGGPGDAQWAVPRVEGGGQHDDGLSGDVGAERDEGSADQSQSSPLAVFTGAGQLPQNDRAGADLDQRVEAEAGQRNRPGCHGCDGQDGDADQVPGQGCALQIHAPAQVLVSGGAGTCGLRHGRNRVRGAGRTLLPVKGMCASAIDRRPSPGGLR
jgi:hypothetical protein